MEELNQVLRSVHKCVVDIVTNKHRAHRYDTAGQPFSRGDDVGNHVEDISGKRAT